MRLLRSRGYPEDVLQAILGHAHYSASPGKLAWPRHSLPSTSFTGLITATALVKPSKSVHDVDARSVLKKMKDKGFARGVSRDDVINGAAELGVELEAHIQFVIGAMQAKAADL